MEDVKKSTYDPKAQKKYNAKRKQIACTVSNEVYEDIKKHSENKGYKSINSFLIDLIDQDMKK